MRHTIIIFLLLTLSLSAYSQDIRITGFEEKPTDLTASIKPEYDNASQAAAVIKFLVNKQDVEIVPNLGVLRKEEKQGEIDLWVPQGTKRITVRYKGMMPLSGYQISVKIVSKKTYEATISIKEKESPLYFMLGYNALPLAGPEVAVGFLSHHHQLEVGFSYGLKKTDDLFFYNNEGGFVSAYNYQPMRLQMRYGYEVELVDFLSVTPQVGVAYNMATGKDVAGYSNINDKYQKVNSVSALGAVRLTAALGRHFKLQVTPEYDFGVYKNLNCKWIGDVDKTVKSWTDGFSLNVGLMVFF